MKVLRTIDAPVTARIIRFTENSAMVSIPSGNAFSTEGEICYVAKAPLEGSEVGALFELPAGELVSKLDENGNVMTYEDGQVLKFYRAPQS
jgi:hypothetical protein